MMGVRKNLEGKKFNKLLVLHEAYREPSGRSMWKCRCDCGKEIIVLGSKLTLGRSKSCGCLIEERKIKLITGDRFGKLILVSQIPGNGNRWLCKCDCGKDKTARASDLVRKDGGLSSCGCAKGGLLDRKQAAINRVYHNIMGGSIKRKISYSLSIEEFSDLVCKPCFYCGEISSNIMTIKTRTHPTDIIKFNGIDRIDSSKGYETGNVVSCCKWCNYAKNSMTTEEFYLWIDKVYHHIHT